MRLVPSSMFKYSSNFHGGAYFCVSFLLFLFRVILSCQFLAALWSTPGKGLTSCPSGIWCFLVFCHVPIWSPGSGVVLDFIDSQSLPSFAYVIILFRLILNDPVNIFFKNVGSCIIVV